MPIASLNQNKRYRLLYLGDAQIIRSYFGATLARQLIQTHGVAYCVSILTSISCKEREKGLGPIPYLWTIIELSRWLLRRREYLWLESVRFGLERRLNRALFSFLANTTFLFVCLFVSFFPFSLFFSFFSLFLADLFFILKLSFKIECKKFRLKKPRNAIAIIADLIRGGKLCYYKRGQNHVFGKRQTSNCTTWPSLLFTCRLLLIISTRE